MTTPIPAWAGADEAELFRYAIPAVDAAKLGITGSALDALNDRLDHEQTMFEASYEATLAEFDEEHRAAVIVMVCGAFQRGFMIGKRLSQVEGEK